MDIDRLATDVVAAVAERLPNLAGAAADVLVDLATARLSDSRAGSRALDALRARPTGEDEQAAVAAVLADEMMRDPLFAARAAETLGMPQSQTSSVTVGSHSVMRGDVAGGSIDRSKRYHVGSMQFGGGGLTALIAVGLIAVGGGGTVAYTVLQEPAQQAQPRNPIDPARSQPQGPAEPAQAQSGGTLLSKGASTDLDDIRGPASGDKVADLVSGAPGEVTATSGARMASLSASLVPSPATCATAIDKQATRTIKNLSPGDTICVVTSRDAIVGATVTDVNDVLLSLDYAYWAS
jgi:hypothetical protein